MEEINFIVTCFDKEKYWPFLKTILEKYKKIKANYVIAYNGNIEGFSEIKIHNSGHHQGDMELTLVGYEALKHNGCGRFVKLSVDSWIIDESRIIDIFEKMQSKKGSNYAGCHWDIYESLSTDIFFATSDLFEKLKKVRKITDMYERIMFNIASNPYIITERHPVHWDNRWKCEKLKWTMHHDLDQNIANYEKYKG